MNLSTDVYLPLPDLDAYLKRIKLDEKPEPTKEFLDKLICHHQMYIPFENLDVFLFRGDPSMSVADIYEKIVVKGRGGYCFEMNNLFWAVLKAVGYDVTPCLVMVLGEAPIPRSFHRGSVVKFADGIYYCDVGFGGPVPAGALKIEAGLKQTFFGDTFEMVPQEDGVYWHLIRYGKESSEPMPMLRVNPNYFDPIDFIPLSHYLCCENSTVRHFQAGLMINIRTDEGHASIMGEILTIRNGANVKRIPLKSDEQVGDVLVNIFGLPEDMREAVKTHSWRVRNL